MKKRKAQRKVSDVPSNSGSDCKFIVDYNLIEKKEQFKLIELGYEPNFLGIQLSSTVNFRICTIR